MEIAKKKVFYTTFAALILSSFTLQTGKADEVQVKPDEAKIDYVNSEAPFLRRHLIQKRLVPRLLVRIDQ